MSFCFSSPDPAIDLRLRALLQSVLRGLGQPVPGLRQLVGNVREARVDEVPVHVAQRDDVLAGQGVEVGAAHAAHSHGRDVDAVIGGDAAGLADRESGQHAERGGGACGLQNVAAGDAHGGSLARRKFLRPLFALRTA
jgi:hypothetical protein